MLGVTTDTPASPTALPVPPPAAAATAGQDGSHAGEQEASPNSGPILTEQALTETHRGNPARGELIAMVRSLISARCPGGEPFSVFAGLFHRKMKMNVVGKTGRAVSRNLIRKRLSDHLSGTGSAPTVDTINAVLLIAVEEPDREATAETLNKLYRQAHPNVNRIGREYPDFVEVIRHPERYMTEPGLAELIRTAGAVPPHIPRSRDSVDETPAVMTTDNATDPVSEPAPQPCQHHDEAWLHEREEVAQFKRKHSPTIRMTQRYEALTRLEREHVTEEQMDEAIRKLDSRYTDQVVEPAKDFAQSAQRWQKSVADQPVTIGLPPTVRNGMVFVFLVALLILLVCLGYQVLVTI